MYAVHREENIKYVPLICQNVGNDESQNGLIHPYIMAIEFYLCTSCMVDIWRCSWDYADEKQKLTYLHWLRDWCSLCCHERCKTTFKCHSLIVSVSLWATLTLGGLQESGFTLYVCLFQVIIERQWHAFTLGCSLWTQFVSSAVTMYAGGTATS